METLQGTIFLPSSYMSVDQQLPVYTVMYTRGVAEQIAISTRVACKKTKMCDFREDLFPSKRKRHQNTCTAIHKTEHRHDNWGKKSENVNPHSRKNI